MEKSMSIETKKERIALSMEIIYFSLPVQKGKTNIIRINNLLLIDSWN